MKFNTTLHYILIKFIVNTLGFILNFISIFCGMQKEVLDENEWWDKIEKMKKGGEQEMVIKRYFSIADQQTLADMAYQHGLHLYVHLILLIASSFDQKLNRNYTFNSIFLISNA